MEPLRVALVGAGYWGPNYVRVFGDLPDAAITTACDLREEPLARLRARFPALRTERDIGAVLRDPAIDAVIIATPARTHADLGRQALEAGKHVLMEKPLALTTADARMLGEAARRAGRTLMVGHIFEYHPAVQRMREALQGGDLGQLRYLAFARTGLGPIRADVNALWDLAPHDVSLAHLLSGEVPERVAAQGASFLRPGVEDVGFATLYLPSGALAHIHVSWLDPHKVRRVTVVGTQKMMTFEDTEPVEKVRIYNKGAELQETDAPADFAQYQVQLRDGDILIPRIPGDEPLRLQCAHFAQCARTGQRPRTDAANGARVVAVLEAVQRALRSGTHEKVEQVA